MNENHDEIAPENFEKCRVCGVWKCLHYKIGDSIRYSNSCDEYIPNDNLEYLELMEQKAWLRKLYEAPMED